MLRDIFLSMLKLILAIGVCIEFLCDRFDSALVVALILLATIVEDGLEDIVRAIKKG